MVGTTTTPEIRYFIGAAGTGDDSPLKSVTMPVAKDFANKDFTNEGFADNDFASLSQSYRSVLPYCYRYRILGSILDAEDLVQETHVRAWHAFEGFQGRTSVRTWLYRTATNAYMNAPDSRKHRMLPTDLTEPHQTPEAAPPADVALLPPTNPAAGAGAGAGAC